MNPASTALQFAFIGLAAAAVYGFAHAARNDHNRASCKAVCELRPAYAGNDRTAPDFELADMTGKKVRLSSYRGRTVVLNFWTKTCKPCLEEMPSIAELAKVKASFCKTLLSMMHGRIKYQKAVEAAPTTMIQRDEPKPMLVGASEPPTTASMKIVEASFAGPEAEASVKKRSRRKSPPASAA